MTDTTAAAPENLQALAGQFYTECKPVLQSRTLWSLAVVGVSMLAARLGHQIGDAQQQQIVDLITGVVNGGGLTAAALFRVVASKQLK